MSVLAMFTCSACEEKNMQARKVKAVHWITIGLLLANLSALSYVAYRLFGAELVCARSALDILDHPREPE